MCSKALVLYTQEGKQYGLSLLSASLVRKIGSTCVATNMGVSA